MLVRGADAVLWHENMNIHLGNDNKVGYSGSP